MATYLELKAKAEKLLIEAEEMRVKEIDAVVADIKQKIEAYGLTAKDLGLSSASTPRPRKTTTSASSKPTAAVKYRGPNGESWSGGRGRKPKWVTEALAQGKKLEDFAVKP